MSAPSRMRILVTGSSGFIGRRVCARLAVDHEVFAVSRRGDASTPCGRLRADLATGFSTAEWPDRIDALLHLAQSARHREFPEGAADMTAVNVTATASLIEYARRARAEVFILASTGNVYTPGSEPVGEDDPVAPPTFYAASKVAAECLVRPYAALMRVCTLRLFYPYGPGQENRLIPSLIDRVRAGRPVSISGSADGLVLTPTYVEDIVDVFCAAIPDAQFRGTLNVSAPGIATLRDVAGTIARLLGREVRFEHTGGSEPPRIIPRLDRLGALYPLAQFASLETGLSRTLRERALAT